MTEQYNHINQILKLDGDFDSQFPGVPAELFSSVKKEGHFTGVSSDPADLKQAPSNVVISDHEEIADLPGEENVESASSVDKLLNHNRAKSLFKSVLVYAIVFAMAFGVFFVILNFGAVIKQIQGLFIKAEPQEVLGAETQSYYEWISGYYFSVSDVDKLDPQNDLDFDGLTNHDEYILKTNPLIADGDEDGYKDGLEVINDYNPWGQGLMNNEQRELVKNIDMILVNNRISYNSAINNNSKLVNKQNTSTLVVTSNTQPNNGAVLGTSQSNASQGIASGKLSIPKLKIQAPIIWSTDPKNFEKDLTKGVIHYPGTAMPGENGIIYITGHSSDYIWKKHPYMQIFSQLNRLEPGDDIFIEVPQSDGSVKAYRYQVTVSKIYGPTDQEQFVGEYSEKLNLSTCWPIGTSKDRLVVSAVPVQL